MTGTGGFLNFLHPSAETVVVVLSRCTSWEISALFCPDRVLFPCRVRLVERGAPQSLLLSESGKVISRCRLLGPLPPLSARLLSHPLG